MTPFYDLLMSCYDHILVLCTLNLFDIVYCTFFEILHPVNNFHIFYPHIYFNWYIFQDNTMKVGGQVVGQWPNVPILTLCADMLS